MLPAPGSDGLRRRAGDDAEGKPDLILLDMALPKLDGFTVVRCLKNNRPLSQIPAVAMAAQTMKGDREEILAAGCEDYIAKPIETVSFLKLIGEWLNR